MPFSNIKCSKILRKVKILTSGVALYTKTDMKRAYTHRTVHHGHDVDKMFYLHRDHGYR